MAARRSSAGLLVAIATAWGSTWIANSMLVDAASALHISMLRYLLAGVFIAPLYGIQQLIRRVRSQPHTAADSPVMNPTTAPASSILPPTDPASAKTYAWLGIGAVLGLSMFALPELLLVWASGHGAGAWTPMIYAALPLGLLLVSGELQPSAILGLGGMLLLLNGSLPVSASKLLWVLPIAAAVAMQGWSLLYVRGHLAEAGSLRCMLVQMLAATLAFQIALRLWPETIPSLPLRSWPTSSLAALCFLAGPATAVAYPLYYRLLRRLEPAQLAASAWAQTVVAVAESALLTRQLPGWPMIGSACLLSFCTIWMLRESVGEESRLRLSTP